MNWQEIIVAFLFLTAVALGVRKYFFNRKNDGCSSCEFNEEKGN